VVIDKSGANALALHNINVQLWLTGKRLDLIEVFQVKYLNNKVEQSHRKVKGKCISVRDGNLMREPVPSCQEWNCVDN
jgi:transposase-like protein